MTTQNVEGIGLIMTTSTKEKEVLNALKKISNVKEIMPLFGKYDLFIKVSADSFESLANVIANDIKKIPGISNIATFLGANI
jgi:DNA-binding Lrp family transcriptional regulator